VKEFVACKAHPSSKKFGFGNSLMTVRGVSEVYKEHFFPFFPSGASFQMPMLLSSLLLWCH